MCVVMNITIKDTLAPELSQNHIIPGFDLDLWVSSRVLLSMTVCTFCSIFSAVHLCFPFIFRFLKPLILKPHT